MPAVPKGLRTTPPIEDETPDEEIIPVDLGKLRLMARRISAEDQTSREVISSAYGDDPTEEEYLILVPLVVDVMRHRMSQPAAVGLATGRLVNRKRFWIEKRIKHMRKYGWPNGVGEPKHTWRRVSS